MKKLSLLIMLTTAGYAIESQAGDALAKAAGIATWVTVAPTASFIINTTPIFWNIGAALLGNAVASRYALGGIVGGTVGTMAGIVVYKKLCDKKS